MIPDTPRVKLVDLVDLDESQLSKLDTFAGALKKELKAARKRLREREESD